MVYYNHSQGKQKNLTGEKSNAPKKIFQKGLTKSIFYVILRHRKEKGGCNIRRISKVSVLHFGKNKIPRGIVGKYCNSPIVKKNIREYIQKEVS